MNEANLRKWHRKMGIILTPLILLQASSGIFLSLDWLLGYHQRIGQVIRRDVPAAIQLWDTMLVTIHYGFGLPGSPYHIAVGIGLIWIVASGVMISLRIRARTRH